ncbi:hypothetical protein VTK26DRAFT_6313 [Humicola hyalothermophila]
MPPSRTRASLLQFEDCHQDQCTAIDYTGNSVDERPQARSSRGPSTAKSKERRHKTVIRESVPSGTALMSPAAPDRMHPRHTSLVPRTTSHRGRIPCHRSRLCHPAVQPPSLQ